MCPIYDDLCILVEAATLAVAAYALHISLHYASRAIAKLNNHLAKWK